MRLPNLDDTPQQRLRFLGAMGLLLLISGGIVWIWLEFFQPPAVVRVQALPFGYKATITEAFGPLDGDGYRLVTAQHGEDVSQQMRFESEDWPVACRFFADAIDPDSLFIVQMNPMLDPQNPGFWLDSKTLKEISLEDLPADLRLLDQVVIE